MATLQYGDRKTHIDSTEQIGVMLRFWDEADRRRALAARLDATNHGHQFSRRTLRCEECDISIVAYHGQRTKEVCTGTPEPHPFGDGLTAATG